MNLYTGHFSKFLMVLTYILEQKLCPKCQIIKYVVEYLVTIITKNYLRYILQFFRVYCRLPNLKGIFYSFPSPLSSSVCMFDCLHGYLFFIYVLLSLFHGQSVLVYLSMALHTLQLFILVMNE